MSELKERFEKILRYLSDEYKVKTPELLFCDNLYVPLSSVSNWKLNNYGNGAYIIKTKTIILELYNPKTNERYSDNALFHCLIHEFVHHLEDQLYGDFGTHKGRFAYLVGKIKKEIIEKSL